MIEQNDLVDNIFVIAVISNKLEGDLLILLVRCSSRLILRGKLSTLAHCVW